MTRRLEVFATRSDVEERVAREVLDVIEMALIERGHADIVVTGGSVGIGTLSAVRRSPRVETIDWRRVHVWWGDERFLPDGHADRNDQQALDALFAHVDIPATNLHRFPVASGQTVDDARDAFVRQHPDGFPIFDVVLNGIGPDGHVASLFPGLPHGTTEAVIAVNNSPKPPAERLSFTFRALNNARQVWIVAAGADKSDAIRRVMSGGPASETPATALECPTGVVVWADALASSEVLD